MHDSPVSTSAAAPPPPPRATPRPRGFEQKGRCCLEAHSCKLFRADMRNRERDEGRPAGEHLCLLKPSQRISKDREIMDLAALADRPFTYTDIGATSGRLPHGYHHVNEAARIRSEEHTS